jgi:L-alanine-DL-glutamate epimerase-like enolase superfamily enzyme
LLTRLQVVLAARHDFERHFLPAPQNAEQLWGLFKTNLAPKSGYCTVPDGPGLGLELDEGAMRALSVS